jgi:hypothetical protein
MIEIIANCHMHTPYSDGEKYHDEIAAVAARAGLDAVIVTDHNVHVRGQEGYRHGVLMLAGEEVHNVRRRPQASHCLVYGAESEVSTFASNPQNLIRQVNERGGMAYLAHPIEYGNGMPFENEPFGWEDWPLRDFTGIEIWNVMSEFKARLSGWPAAVFYVLFPSLALRGPFPGALRLWDSLHAEGRRVAAIGNADAHGTMFGVGPIRRAVLPYDYLFGCVNNHLLLEKPFSGDFETDKRLLLNALRVGRGFVGCDRFGDTRGFRFTAGNGHDNAAMGGEIRRTGMVRYRVQSPHKASIRLLCNGRVMAQADTDELELQSLERGAWRVEVHRRWRGRRVGWIFSNPIYAV